MITHLAVIARSVFQRRSNLKHRAKLEIASSYTTLLAMTLLCLGSSSVCFASNKNAGTSGAQFLKIGAGARPTAMGNAFVGVADDVNAIYFNPAGLAMLERPELTALHTQWFQGLNYDFGAFSLPTEMGAFGISVATLKADDLEKRSVDEALQGTFDTLDAAYSLAYAKEILPHFSLGVTARYLKEQIDTTAASAWGADVGVFKQFESQPVSLGFAIRHFGQSVKFDEEGDPQPLEFDLGGGIRLFQNKLLLGLDVKKARDNDVQFGGGTEFKQTIRNDFRYALRTGYTTAGTDSDGTTGISLGAGMGYKQFDLDFAWVPFGDLGNTFRYAAVIKF